MGPTSLSRTNLLLLLKNPYTYELYHLPLNFCNGWARTNAFINERRRLCLVCGHVPCSSIVEFDLTLPTTSSALAYVSHHNGSCFHSNCRSDLNDRATEDGARRLFFRKGNWNAWAARFEESSSLLILGLRHRGVV